MASPSDRTLEGDYQRTLLARVALEFRDHRFFRRNVGLIKLDNARVFRSSIPGQCDLYVVGKGGWHGEVELKRFTTLNEAQERWRDWCAEWNVPWLMLRASKEEKPSQTIDRWISELRPWLAPRA